MPNKTPVKFFIVTPSYNQGQFIEETIESVLTQVDLDNQAISDIPIELEYWVVDGGSTDDTLGILKRYNEKYANFHYISEPDEGQSDAINKGLKKGVDGLSGGKKNDVLAYINSDDCYLPGAFKEIAELVISEKKDLPASMWFYGRSIIVDKAGIPIQSFFSKVKNFLGKKYSYSKLLTLNIISQPAVFLKREVFEEFGYFDKDSHRIMDYEYWLRIGKRYPGKPVLKNLAKYRYYADSKSGSQFFVQYFEEWKKAWEYSRKIVDFPLMVLHGLHFLLVSFWMKFIAK